MIDLIKEELVRVREELKSKTETELEALKTANGGFTWVELVADEDVPDPA